MNPLSVRINDGAGNDRHVRYTGLKFRKSAWGGWVAAEVTVKAGPNDFTDLGPNDRIYVYDTRTGAVVWEGYCDNPGVSAGPLGQVYTLTALGGSKWAGSFAAPYAVVDRRPDMWVRSGYSTADAETATIPDMTGISGVLDTKANVGATVPTTWLGGHLYVMPDGYFVNRVQFTHVSGVTDANYLIAASIQVGPPPAVPSGIITTSANTTPATVSNAPASTTADRVHVMAGRSGSSIAATNGHWFDIYGMYVRATMVDKYGDYIAAGFSLNETYSHEVIADLIGRQFLQQVDPDRCDIFTGSAPIDQLMAEDGTTGSSVLDLLALHEDFTWGYFETTDAGLHRFAASRWDSEARYEISVKDGYTQPGSDFDRCNHILVHYTDFGVSKTLHVYSAGATAPWVDADAVTIPDGYGSADVAQRMGEQILAARSQPTLSARALVRRPIMDLVLGREVMPWEIEAGHTVRVREPGYELRLSEVEYDHESRSAALTLGTPISTPEELLASLTKKSAGPGWKQVQMSEWSKQVRNASNNLTATQGGWVSTLGNGSRG